MSRRMLRLSIEEEVINTEPTVIDENFELVSDPMEGASIDIQANNDQIDIALEMLSVIGENIDRMQENGNKNPELIDASLNMINVVSSQFGNAKPIALESLGNFKDKQTIALESVDSISKRIAQAIDIEIETYKNIFTNRYITSSQRISKNIGILNGISVDVKQLKDERQEVSLVGIGHFFTLNGKKITTLIDIIKKDQEISRKIGIELPKKMLIELKKLIDIFNKGSYKNEKEFIDFVKSFKNIKKQSEVFPIEKLNRTVLLGNSVLYIYTGTRKKDAKYKDETFTELSDLTEQELLYEFGGDYIDGEEPTLSNTYGKLILNTALKAYDIATASTVSVKNSEIKELIDLAYEYNDMFNEIKDIKNEFELLCDHLEKAMKKFSTIGNNIEEVGFFSLVKRYHIWRIFARIKKVTSNQLDAIIHPSSTEYVRIASGFSALTTLIKHLVRNAE